MAGGCYIQSQDSDPDDLAVQLFADERATIGGRFGGSSKGIRHVRANPSELTILCPLCFGDVPLEDAVSRNSCRHLVCQTCLTRLGSGDPRFVDVCYECQIPTKTFSHCLSCAKVLPNEDMFEGCVSCSPTVAAVRRGRTKPYWQRDRRGEDNTDSPEDVQNSEIFVKTATHTDIFMDHVLNDIRQRCRDFSAGVCEKVLAAPVDKRICLSCHYDGSVKAFLFVDVPLAAILVVVFDLQQQVLDISSNIMVVARHKQFYNVGDRDKGNAPEFYIRFHFATFAIWILLLVFARLRYPRDGAFILHASAFLFAYIWEVEFHTWLNFGMFATNTVGFWHINPWYSTPSAWAVFPNSLGGRLALVHGLILVVPFMAALVYSLKKRWFYEDEVQNLAKFFMCLGLMGTFFAGLITVFTENFYWCTAGEMCAWQMHRARESNAYIDGMAEVIGMTHSTIFDPILPFVRQIKINSHPAYFGCTTPACPEMSAVGLQYAFSNFQRNSFFNFHFDVLCNFQNFGCWY